MSENNKKMLEAISTQNIELDNNTEKNIFEVAGFPHYERVSSNILAFFLDTEEEHGMGDKWLKALLRSYIKHVNQYDNHLERYINSQMNVTYVNCEEETDSGKFIDIVIETEDLVVAIENKIEASGYNDFSDYGRFVLKREKKDTILVLLSVDKLGDRGDFKNILYSDLISEIKHLPNSTDDNKWNMFEKEYINNMEKRANNSIKVDTNWISFSNRYSPDMELLLNKVLQEIGVKHNYLQYVLESLNKTKFAGFQFHGKSKWEGYQSIFKDYYLNSQYEVTLEPFFMNTPLKSEYNSCLYISLWVRDKKKRRICIPKIEKYLGQTSFKDKFSRKDSHSDWGSYLVLIEDNFENVDLTIKSIQEVEELIQEGIRNKWE